MGGDGDDTVYVGELLVLSTRPLFFCVSLNPPLALPGGDLIRGSVSIAPPPRRPPPQIRKSVILLGNGFKRRPEAPKFAGGTSVIA